MFLIIEYRQYSSHKNKLVEGSRCLAWTILCLLCERSLGGNLMIDKSTDGYTPFLFTQTMSKIKILSRLSVILFSLLFFSCSNDDDPSGGGSSSAGYAPDNIVNKEIRFYKEESDKWFFKSFMRSENGDVTILTSSSIAVVGDETAYYEKNGDNSAMFKCYFVTQVVVGGNIYGSWNQYELNLTILSHNHGTFSGKQLANPYDNTGTSISGRFIFDSESEPSEFTWATPPVTGVIDYKYLTINVWTDEKTERFLKFNTDGTFKQYLNFGGEEIKESGTYTIDSNRNVITLKSPSGRVSESFKVTELTLASFVVFMPDINGNYLSELSLEYRPATREDDIPPYITNDNTDDNIGNNNNDNTNNDENTDNGNNNEATTGTISGHDWVDLGLSVKWATCNVGASKPEDYGDYYAWGETETKSNYTWKTYKWCNGSKDTMTKYCTNSNYGTVDNKTVLEPEDDVAHVQCGGSWRMPTRAEQDELEEKCTWNWTTLNGIKGYKVTGPNGKSIFLPAAGCLHGTGVNNRGTHGEYWLSSLSSNGSNYAYCSYFYSSKYGWASIYRYLGYTVRPVSE